MTTNIKKQFTLKGEPITVLGPELKPGNKAPEFTLLDNDLSVVNSKKFKGKTRLIMSVPSLDTPVCDQQVHQFYKAVTSLDKNIEILVISSDLPFAQKRWCGSAGIEKITVLSDHREMLFGKVYGTLIEELRLESRAVFVVDVTDTVTYSEYVPEMTEYPNYKGALNALEAASK